MGPRGAGRRLNDQERMEILEIMARESKVKNVDLAKRYGVSEGAIRKLKQIKDTIRDRYYLGNEHNRDKRKRGGFKRNAPFEQELYEWICRMRETQAYQLLPLTQTAVRQQAIVLSKNYERMANFKASPGWFARFCSRHRLDPPMTSAGSAIATSDAAASAAAPSAAVDVTMEAKPPTTAEDTVFLMDPLVSGSVSATAAAVMVDAAMTPASAGVEIEGKSATATEGLKQETPSINEQAQVAAREHNAAALTAATARETPSTAKPAEEAQPSLEEEKRPSEPAETTIGPSLTKVEGLGGSSSSTASGSATPTSSNGSASKKKKNKKKKSKSKQEGAASRDEDVENQPAISNTNGSNEDTDPAQLPLARRLEVAAAIPDTHAALLGLLGWSRLYVNTDTILTFFQSDALPLLLTNVLRSHSPAAVFDNLAAMLANCLSIETNPSSADSSGSAPHREMANEVVAAVRTIADELHGGADAEDADANAEAERTARALSRLVCGHALSLHGVELGSPLTRDVQVLETKIAEVMRADESVHGQTIRDSFQRRDLRSDALTLHESRLRKLNQLVEERVRSSEQQHQQVDEEEGEEEEDADEQRQTAQNETEMKKVTEWLQEMQERKDAELAPLRASQATATAETQTLRQRRDELEAQLRAVEDELQRVSGMQQQADEDVCAVEQRYLADTARFRAEHQHVARRFTRAQHRRVIAAEVARVDHEVRQARLAHSQVHALRSKQAACLAQQLEASLSYFESELPCMKFMLARVAENESELAPLRDEATRYRTLGVSAIAKELEDKAAALEAHLEEDRGCLLALRTRDLELLDGMRCMLTDPALRDIVGGLDEKLKHEVQRMIDYVGKLYDLPVTNGSTTSEPTNNGEGGVKA
ncbi:hypothetical protein BBJ28_00012795 [Nothophytophthora sp. Chile5]|nr:hypothetical protein BBJ28_00012795 [Nothophytophthora sp. Chile5]